MFLLSLNKRTLLLGAEIYFVGRKAKRSYERIGIWSKVRACVHIRGHRSVFILYAQSISLCASVIRRCVRPLTKQRHHSKTALGSSSSLRKESLPKCNAVKVTYNSHIHSITRRVHTSSKDRTRGVLSPDTCFIFVVCVCILIIYILFYIIYFSYIFRDTFYLNIN